MRTTSCFRCCRCSSRIGGVRNKNKSCDGTPPSRNGHRKFTDEDLWRRSANVRHILPKSTLKPLHLTFWPEKTKGKSRLGTAFVSRVRSQPHTICGDGLVKRATSE